jgi:CRISPR system Cascade subunit CasE
MYLSQLTLNPRSRQVRRELSNPYEMHRTLLQAFPDKDAGGPGRVLFRFDTLGRAAEQKLVVLVQSDKEPNWDNLPDSDTYLLPTFDPNPATKEFSPAFIAGQRLYFRLRANPTKRLLHDDPERKQKKGQRVGLYSEEEQLVWLHRKATNGGFKVLEVNLTNDGTTAGKTKDQHQLNLLAVRFEGQLQVIEPDRFLETVQDGLGSGKGLGFGLLSLARV